MQSKKKYLPKKQKRSKNSSKKLVLKWK